MAFFTLDCVLRWLPAAAYSSTPHRKPLCGLVQRKKITFTNWTLNSVFIYSWMVNN
jgi:hypothetical protein